MRAQYRVAMHPYYVSRLYSFLKILSHIMDTAAALYDIMDTAAALYEPQPTRDWDVPFHSDDWAQGLELEDCVEVGHHKQVSTKKPSFR
jgi:hypothetical protein